MCNFLSALVLPSGEVLSHDLLDSHTDLITYFKLRDDRMGLFAKVELVPGNDWLDPSTWVWTLDEPTTPAWWTEALASSARATLEARANRMILRDGTHTLILEGSWIVGGTAVVNDVRGGLIRRVQDSAAVRDVGGSAAVRDVRGSATVQNVWDSATVQGVWGSATVQGVWGSATVQGVAGSATVQGVRDSATVQNVWDSATVRDVRGSATVRNVGPRVTLDDSARAHLIPT